MLVAKLRGARERKRKTGVKVDGRKKRFPDEAAPARAAALGVPGPRPRKATRAKRGALPACGLPQPRGKLARDSSLDLAPRPAKAGLFS